MGISVQGTAKRSRSPWARALAAPSRPGVWAEESMAPIRNMAGGETTDNAKMMAGTGEGGQDQRKARESHQHCRDGAVQ